MPAVSVVGDPEDRGDLLGGEVGAALLDGPWRLTTPTSSACRSTRQWARVRRWRGCRRLRRSRSGPPPGRGPPRPTSSASPPHLSPASLGAAHASPRRRLACRGVTTFADVLARRLRAEPGQPLVTYYDLRTGERVELSVTTYANWVAKAASLLAEEHGLERGQRLRVDLPTHWLGPVFLGAAWAVGLVVTERRRSRRRGVRAGRPRTVGAVRRPGAGARVLAAADGGALRGRRCRRASTTSAWRSGPSRTPSRRGTRPRGRDPATDRLTHDELWSRVAAGTSHYPGGGRLLSTANPASPSGLASLTGPLGGSGSVVLVSGAPVDDPADDEVSRVFDSERCTGRYEPD